MMGQVQYWFCVGRRSLWGDTKKVICVLGAQNLGRNPLFSAGGCFLKTSTVKAGDERTRFQGSNVTLAWTWKEHKVK